MCRKMTQEAERYFDFNIYTRYVAISVVTHTHRTTTVTIAHVYENVWGKKRTSLVQSVDHTIV